MNLCDYNDIRALLGRHGFHFSKSMGQNFLIDPQVPHDIAAASQADGDCGVLEIGPGIGPLTAELAQRAGKVVSVELDQKLLPILEETMAPYPNVEIVPGDIMKLDLAGLVSGKLAGYRPLVCANLPYNITTPVLTRLLECGLFQSITVLIQREVARRICASPGSGDYGAFGLFVQWHMETELLFDVPPSCFVPQPKVTSSVIRLRRRENPPVPVNNEALLFRIIRAAFNQRRKTLVNALSSGLGLDKAVVEQCLEKCGFDTKIRGESLDIGRFAKIADEIGNMRGCDL